METEKEQACSGESWGAAIVEVVGWTAEVGRRESGNEVVPAKTGGRARRGHGMGVDTACAQVADDMTRGAGLLEAFFLMIGNGSHGMRDPSRSAAWRLCTVPPAAGYMSATSYCVHSHQRPRLVLAHHSTRSTHAGTSADRGWATVGRRAMSSVSALPRHP